VHSSSAGVALRPFPGFPSLKVYYSTVVDPYFLI